LPPRGCPLRARTLPSDARLMLYVVPPLTPASPCRRVGGLDATCDWASVLSLGEQQRVAFLRLLLHRPSLAFLDESTSALDEATEAALYSALKERCPCYLSIGHHMQLVQYHSHVLQYQGEGRWELRTAEEFARKREKR